MPDPSKYAVVERERRFLVSCIPDGVSDVKEIIDRYVDGTRLRLREVIQPDGVTIRKLSHKVRLADGPAEVACTNFYLTDNEWAVLRTLPAHVLRKHRHMVHRDGLIVAVDEHEDGTLVAEIDDGDSAPSNVPAWLNVIKDVSASEEWTGGQLAQRR